MIKDPPQELLKAFAQMGAIHITPIYVCDHCQDEDKEAFPYGVIDKKGNHWNDLCNDCFDELGCSYDEGEAAK